MDKAQKSSQKGSGRNPVELLFDAWRATRKVPFGDKIFAFALGRIVPYTGALGSEVKVIEKGRCLVELSDRRIVRNHLGSIHAMALANLAEICSGLCMLYTIGNQYRGILSGFQISYFKKARGRLFAECLFSPSEDTLKNPEIKIPVVIKNSDGVVVAEAVATWNIKRI